MLFSGPIRSKEVTDVPVHHAPVPAPGGRAADALLQHRGRPARTAATAAPPGDQRARRPSRPGAALPDGADQAGGQRRAVHRDPRAGARRLPHLSAVAAGPGTGPGAVARYAGPHLLQVRGRLAGRLAQAEHGHRAGLLQPRGGRPAARHRDRCRPVGERACLRRRAVRPGDEGLHGQGQLRAEAVPAQLHPDLGCQRRRRRRPRRRTPAAPSWREDPDSTGSPGHRHQRGASRWRPPTRTPSTRWAAC